MRVDPLGTLTHTRIDSSAALNLFAQEAARFESAFATAMERREAWLTLAGHRIRLRVAGGAMADAVLSAFAHLRSRRHDDGVPALGIDVWDESEAPGSSPAEDLWDRVRSADGRWFQDVTPFVSGWLDRSGHRLVARITSAAWLNGGEVVYQPFSNLLALWLADRATPAVHAGAVARNGRGILIAGRSGAGKSTVSLSCLIAGFDYIGDDFVVLSAGDAAAFVAHGLYSTAHLSREHLKRFPSLAPAVSPGSPDQGKAVIRLEHAFPARLARHAIVQAIVLPRFASGGETCLRSAPRSDVLMAITSSSLFARPAATPAAFHALGALVEAVPAYWLETSTDIPAIPGVLERLFP